LAERTNLIKKDKNDQIFDLYDSLIKDIKDELSDESCPLDSSVKEALLENLTRKLVKKIFMPIVYGKTQHAAAADIYEELSFILLKNECYKVAAYLFEIWHSKNPTIVGLMSLFNQIGWFASYLGRPVRYDSYFVQTIQDYTVHNPIHVALYDKKKKKRHKVTLSVPTTQRNKTKSMRATFANCIHQFYSTISCLVTAFVKVDPYYYFPLYTVHDNFLTNAVNASKIPTYYVYAFIKLLDPLFIVNRMLYQKYY